MNTNQAAQPPHAGAGAPPARATQAARMQAAIDKAVAVAPGFLRGDVDADHMAHTMVGAVHGYVEQDRADGGDGNGRSPEARQLQNALAELVACGSGYLAGRCDAACVARTMTQMMREFGTR
ncbi:MAG TPA: hypothetical protein VJL61_01385 [Rhodanobacteraceae bacterium]|nr:hypothetical protein [Rhodanobacteraceae bacterium]